MKCKGVRRTGPLRASKNDYYFFFLAAFFAAFLGAAFLPFFAAFFAAFLAMVNGFDVKRKILRDVVRNIVYECSHHLVLISLDPSDRSS